MRAALAVQWECVARLCECAYPYTARGGRAYIQAAMQHLHGVTLLVLLYNSISIIIYFAFLCYSYIEILLKYMLPYNGQLTDASGINFYSLFSIEDRGVTVFIK